MGEAINLVNNFKVDKVIFNCGPYNDLEKELIKVLDKKKIKYYSCIKELNIDDNRLYFLNNKDYDNENDNSNVIYTEINGYKFMFTGDVGIEKEEDILDNMGSDELIANLFRISQTEQKSKNENIKLETEANDTLYEVGKEIRNTIKKFGGTMPENLPTPERSLKEL